MNTPVEVLEGMTDFCSLDISFTDIEVCVLSESALQIAFILIKRSNIQKLNHLIRGSFARTLMSVSINIFLVVPYELLISEHIKHVSSLIAWTSAARESNGSPVVFVCRG